MTDTLTESFCERCGTRYEFEAPTRLNPLRKTRGFIGGLKNYLTSQDDMSDAMRDAMRQQEEALASAQLEAFHESFNFCIDCRQYTCVNCWNDGAGRCRSCAPIPGTDDLAERLAASVAGNGSVAIAEPTLAEDEIQRRLGMDAWPTSDLPEHVHTNGHRADLAWPDTDAVDEPMVADDEPEREPAAAEFVPEPEPEPVVAEVEPEPEPEPVVAEFVPEPEPQPEPEPMVAEIEPEPVVAEFVPEPEAEPFVAEIEPEPVAEPVVAEAEPTPEPVVAEIEPEPEPVAAQIDARPYEPWIEPEPVVTEAEPEFEAEPVVAQAEPTPEPFVAEIEPEPEPVAAQIDARPYEPWIEPEPVVGEAEPEFEPEPEPVVAEADEAMPALRVVGWEPDTAYDVFTDEPVLAEGEPEPVVAEVEPEPEPVVAEVEPEPEPVVAEVEPEPEPTPARRPMAPIGDTILRFPGRQTDAPTERQAAEDESPEVAARRAQLDLLGLGDPGEGPVEQTRPAVLPYRSRGAAAGSGQLSARATQAGGSTFWEASAREVAGAAANIGVQACGQCGLSLSANARFCRRCGTRQAQSA